MRYSLQLLGSAAIAVAMAAPAQAQVSFVESGAVEAQRFGVRHAAPPPARRYGLEKSGGLYLPYANQLPGARLPMTIDSRVTRAAFPPAGSLATSPAPYVYGGGQRIPDRAMTVRPTRLDSGAVQPLRYLPTEYLQRRARFAPISDPASGAAPVPPVVVEVVVAAPPPPSSSMGKRSDREHAVVPMARSAKTPQSKQAGMASSS